MSVFAGNRMEFSRRRLLLLSSAGVAGLAGCSETSVNSPDGQDGTNGGSDGDSESGGTQGGSFELGQTAEFTVGEDTAIDFTPTRAILHEAFVYSTSGSLFSEVPERSGRLFLTIEIKAKNTGSESFRPPSTIVFTSGGTQYDLTYTSAYSESSFAQYSEIQPGASRTGWVVFEIPSSATKGSLIAEFQTVTGSATGKWSVDLSDADKKILDIEELSSGESASIGTETTSYSMSALSVEETQSYDYSIDEYSYTEEAGDGKKFILVTVQSENTGERTVSVPSTYGMSLISDGSQYDAGRYRDDDDAYEGGEISSGITRRGIVQFEVPESASSYTLQADLTQDLKATWEL